MRQVANTHKDVGDRLRGERQAGERAQAAQQLETFANMAWAKARREPIDLPPEVKLTDSPVIAASMRREGSLVYEKGGLKSLEKLKTTNRAHQLEFDRRERVLKAIATVLDGHGVFSDMPYTQQHELLDALLEIYFENELK